MLIRESTVVAPRQPEPSLRTWDVPNLLAIRILRQHGGMKSYFFSLLLLMFGSSYLQANISIITKTLGNGTVNTPYSAVIATSGGCSPATWAISSGTLPAGIAMTASNKPISLSLTGAPTRAATYSFTVKVTGCHGASSTKLVHGYNSSDSQPCG